MAFKFSLTEFGKAALIHSLAGGNISFDTMEIGGSETEPKDFTKMTVLADYKFNAKVISQKKIENTLNLKFQFDNSKVDSAFYWTEIGYFATVKKSDGNMESGLMIYGYDNKATAKHIPSYTANNTLNKYICQIGINYSDESNVKINLDEFEDYVEKADFTNHLNSNNPHNINCEMINAASKTHNHSAIDITSGALGVERGGTGVTSLSKLKELLDVNVLHDYSSQVAFDSNFRNFYNCQFCVKNGIAIVVVSCQINKTVNSDSQSNVMLTLPEEMRPLSDLSFMGFSNNKDIFTVLIQPNGTVMYTSFGNFFSLSENSFIRFQASYPVA